MSVFNGVYGNSFNRNTSSIECVFVCVRVCVRHLAAMFSPSRQLTDAEGIAGGTEERGEVKQ